MFLHSSNNFSYKFHTNLCWFKIFNNFNCLFCIYIDLSLSNTNLHIQHNLGSSQILNVFTKTGHIFCNFILNYVVSIFTQNCLLLYSHLHITLPLKIKSKPKIFWLSNMQIHYHIWYHWKSHLQTIRNQLL